MTFAGFFFWLASCAICIVLGYELRRVQVTLAEKRIAADASRIDEIKRLAHEAIAEHVSRFGPITQPAAAPLPASAKTPEKPWPR